MLPIKSLDSTDDLRDSTGNSIRFYKGWPPRWKSIDFQFENTETNVNSCSRFHSNTPGWNWICPISSKEWRWEKGRNNFTRISINFVDTMNWKNKIKLSFDPTLAAIIDDVNSKYFGKVCLRIRAVANWYYLKSIHFMKAVLRISFLSKLWYFLFWFVLKVP